MAELVLACWRSTNFWIFPVDALGSITATVSPRSYGLFDTFFSS